MEVNGWKLYGHPLLVSQLQKLEAAVKTLREEDPEGYIGHPKAKLLATLNRLIQDIIPSDPSAPEFRQGNTLGKDNKHWFRAKFHARYRMFFRFSSKHKAIVYVWVNDERTLRQSGAKSDPYEVFKSLLESGKPPQDFEALLKRSTLLEN
jgi:toxin YhaV